MTGETFTAEVLSAWVPLEEAMKAVKAIQGDAGYGSLVSRLATGLIRSGAENYFGKDGKLAGPVEIQPGIWKLVEDKGHIWSQPFWKTNDMTVTAYSRYDQTEYKFFGVRLDPDGLRKIPGFKSAQQAGRPTTLASPPASALNETKLPPGKISSQLPPAIASVATSPPAPPAPKQAPAPSRAGRPRKDFWDELIIATMKAIWDGDLQPQTYADIERWMLNWASDHDHKLSETAVKEPARKIFAAHQS